MTRDDLAKLIYHGPRIGFDVGWDHKNIREETRDLYRATADRVAAALGVALDDSPSQLGSGGDCGELEGIAVTLGRRIHHDQRAADDLDGIADDMAQKSTHVYDYRGWLETLDAYATRVRAIAANLRGN